MILKVSNVPADLSSEASDSFDDAASVASAPVDIKNNPLIVRKTKSRRRHGFDDIESIRSQARILKLRTSFDQQFGPTIMRFPVEYIFKIDHKMCRLSDKNNKIEKRHNLQPSDFEGLGSQKCFDNIF